MERLRCATYNVLADAYLGWGDYSHVPAGLLEPGARLPLLVRLIGELQADVIGLQEAEPVLVAALDATGKWQRPLWSPKTDGEPDGCLMLVRKGITVTNFETHAYRDGSGHIMQSMVIGGVVFANTHILWERPSPNHRGVAQTKKLLERLGKGPAVILADCNDRPGGPIRELVAAAGFTNTCGDKPTAFVNQELAALDLLAVRGVNAEPIETTFRPEGIPSTADPSDHIPVMAYVEIP